MCREEIAMSFKNHDVKKEYRSLTDNVVQNFYIPLLNESVYYKRAVGFFSSSVLIEISKGISGLVKNGGKIQLIASPYLSDDDLEAIKKGYKERNEVVEKALINSLSDDLHDYYSIERLNMLANLIAQGTMDIKIALTEDEKGIGMYHEKMGILEDGAGNKIAFSGSMNESKTALSINYEAIDVYCDWESKDARERVELKEEAFDKIWNNEDENVDIMEVPCLTEEIIKKYNKKAPNYNVDHEQFPTDTIKEKHSCDRPLGARIPQDVKLHDYQEDAIVSWVGENYRGIFDMATGTGKTFTGLGAISKISEDLNDYLVVIIVCPYQHLVDQWVEDIEKFNMNPIICYSSSPQKDWKNRLSKSIRDQKLRDEKRFISIISTNATFASDFFQNAISKIKSKILLVVDEAHNFGAKNLQKLLDDRFDYRLALSATLDRHNDEEGTNLLYSFFGKKCIEYSLKRAIKEGKLTEYEYIPVLVYLNRDELTDYENISYEMAKHVIKGRNGKPKLDSYGEILAIKRSRVVAGALNKLTKLKEEIEKYKNDHYILVYCGATSILNPSKDSSDTDEQDVRQIIAVTNILGNELGIKCARFTSEENVDERRMIKEHFQNGDDLQAIVAIKCLDEGVNIPGIRTAFILASSTNPKEYIQRRGRVLRIAKGKDYAVIYDFVTLPRPLDEVPGLTGDQMKRDLSLVRNELKRVKEFGEASRNSMKANKLIWEICDVYHLPYNFTEKEEDENGEPGN